MNKIGSVFKSCDMYGVKPNILYDRQSSYRTSAGAMITIFGMIFSCVCSVLIGWMYFSKKSASISVDTIYQKDPQGFVLSKDVISFGFGIFDTTTFMPWIDSSVFEVQVIYQSRVEETVNGVVKHSLTMTPLTVVPCSETKLDQNTYSNVDSSKLWCLEEFKTETKKVKIAGQFTSDEFGAIIFDVKKCSGPHCKTDAEMNEILKRSQFGLFYSTFVIQGSNYDNPVEKYSTLSYTNTSPFFSKEYTMWMADHEVITQSAFTSYMPYHSRTVSAVDRFETNLIGVSNGSDNPDFLIRFIVQMSGKKLVTNRNYQTLFEAFAELGGIFNLFTFICFFASSQVSTTLLKLDLASKVTFSGHLLGGREKPDSIASQSRGSIEPSQPQLLLKKRQNHRPQPLKQATAQTHSLFRSSKVHNFLQADSNENSLNNKPNQLENIENKSVSDQLDPEAWKSNQPASGGERVPNNTIWPKQPTSMEDPQQQDQQRETKEVGVCSVFLESFFPFLLPKQSTIKKILKHADHSVLRKFDFLNILKMMDDIEKLKLLIFTPTQLQQIDAIDVGRFASSVGRKQQSVSRKEWISEESSVPLILQLDTIIPSLTEEQAMNSSSALVGGV